jgi:hypothetical protein
MYRVIQVDKLIIKMKLILAKSNLSTRMYRTEHKSELTFI